MGLRRGHGLRPAGRACSAEAHRHGFAFSVNMEHLRSSRSPDRCTPKLPLIDEHFDGFRSVQPQQNAEMPNTPGRRVQDGGHHRVPHEGAEIGQDQVFVAARLSASSALPSPPSAYHPRAAPRQTFGGVVDDGGDHGEQQQPNAKNAQQKLSMELHRGLML